MKRIGLVAFALALVIGATAVAAADPATETIDKQHELAAGGKLEVGNIAGRISIQGGERRSVSIRAVKRAKDPAQLTKVEVRIEAEDKKIRIRTLYGNESAWEKLKGLFSGGSLAGVEVDYTISLPRDAEIEATSVSGSIEVTDTKAPLSLETVSGAVSARLATAGGRVKTVSGRIDARAVTAGPEAGVWKLDSVSGDVALELGAGAWKGASIQTVSGDVKVAVPKGATADVSFSTVSGKSQGTEALGHGGPSLKVNTVSGDLAVSTSAQ